jgi:hypothetical protein
MPAASESVAARDSHKKAQEARKADPILHVFVLFCAFSWQ